MRFPVLLVTVFLLFPASCSSDGGDPSMDVGGGRWDDIPALEINAFTPIEESFCVGQQVEDDFADYDYQCEAAVGKGKCVQMPNPHSGKTYYCALCGLKGANMVCYFINQE